MNDLTDEQLRRIDAAVAECIGYEWVTADGVRILASPDAPNTLKSWLPASGDEPLAEGDWVAMVPRFATNPAAWYQVEQWMLENWDVANGGWSKKMAYVNIIARQLMNLAVLHMPEQETAFLVATAPLSYRCIAFLGAMGKDVNEILQEAQHGQSE